MTKKWWKRTRETIIPEPTNSASKKMLGKKSSQNIAKKRFLNTHEYRDLKMVKKTRETIFPETQQ